VWKILCLWFTEWKFHCIGPNEPSFRWRLFWPSNIWTLHNTEQTQTSRPTCNQYPTPQGKYFWPSVKGTVSIVQFVPKQWCTQAFFLCVAIGGGGSTNLVQDRGQIERGSWSGTPLDRGFHSIYKSMKPIFWICRFGCVFHRTGNSAQLWQKFEFDGTPPFLIKGVIATNSGVFTVLNIAYFPTQRGWHTLRCILPNWIPPTGCKFTEVRPTCESARTYSSTDLCADHLNPLASPPWEVGGGYIPGKGEWPTN
jgi:hypothetical protein